jgi:hypothetical protein
MRPRMDCARTALSPPDVAQPDAYRAAFEEIRGDNWKTM